MIELAGNADHQLAYEALSQLAAGGQAGSGHTIVIQGKNYNSYIIIYIQSECRSRSPDIVNGLIFMKFGE